MFLYPTFRLWHNWEGRALLGTGCNCSGKKMSKRSPIASHRSTASKISKITSKEVEKLTNDEIREELLELGKEPGPVNDGNRYYV